MKKSGPQRLVWAACVLLIILSTGCEEEQRLDTPAEVKRSRIIAVENTRLKEEIRVLKTQNEKKLRRQQGLLDKCMQEKQTLEDQLNKGAEKFVNEAFKSFGAEIPELYKENADLKKQVTELEAEVLRVKKELEQMKK